jgi:hypothetical protein
VGEASLLARMKARLFSKELWLRMLLYRKLASVGSESWRDRGGGGE